MFDRRLMKNFDIALLLTAFCVIGIGVTMIYSSTYRLNGGNSRYYVRQIYWLLVGLLALLAVISFDYRKLVKMGYLIYTVSLILLVLLLLKSGRGDARRWMELGFFRFQPSELAKLSVLLALTQYIYDRQKSLAGLRDLIIPFIILLIPVGLILIEPDLGTTLVFFPMLLIMLYLGGLPFRYIFFIITPIISMIISVSLWYWLLFLLILLALVYYTRTTLFEGIFIWGVNLATGIATPIMWNLLKGYQKNRLLVFLNPERDPLGAGYNIIQSKIAIGSGGMWGKGLLMGTQNQLNFLPEQHTDFIFSILGEEGGFFWAFILLSLYTFFLFRALDIAANAKDDRGSLLAGGIIGLFLFHIFINIGMTIGIMPITGLPLPFMSYGGTALLTNMVLVGILENIRMRRFETHR